MAKITAALARGYRESAQQRNEVQMKKYMADYQFLQQFMRDQVSPYAQKLRAVQKKADADAKLERESVIREIGSRVETDEELIQQYVTDEASKRILLNNLHSLANNPSKAGLDDYKRKFDELFKNYREKAEQEETERRGLERSKKLEEYKSSMRQLQQPKTPSVGVERYTKREGPNGAITPGILHIYERNESTGEEKHLGTMPERSGQNAGDYLKGFEPGANGGDTFGTMPGQTGTGQQQLTPAPTDTTNVDWRFLENEMLQKKSGR